MAESVAGIDEVSSPVTVRGLRVKLRRVQPSWILSQGVRLVLGIRGSARFVDRACEGTGTALLSAVIGPRTYALRVEPVDELCCVALTLPPSVAYRVLGVPLNTMVNTVARPVDVLGERGPALERAVRAAVGWPARLTAVVSALRDWCGDGPSWCAEVETAWRLVGRSGGTIRIGELARAVALSPRALEMRYLDQVGVSPKRSGRLVRMCRSLGLLGAGRSVSEIAETAGYYDQAHFARDFKDLMTMTPGEFRAGNGEALDAAGCHACETAPELLAAIDSWPTTS